MGKRVHYAGALAATAALLLGSVAGCPFHAETFVQHCAADTDCDDGIECTTDKCTNTVCSNTDEAAHTPCSNGGVCDGKVTCLGCIDDTDCMMFHSTSPVCDPKTQACVSCHDGIKNGNEQGIDCGGPDCGSCLGNPCDDDGGAACGDNTVCDTKENICCSTPCDPTVTNCITCSMKNGAMADGTCGSVTFGQDPFGQCNITGMATAGGCGKTMGRCACEDGQVDGKETDVDCGGGVCPGCEGGQMCAQDSDCDPNFGNCVPPAPGSASKVCCNSQCGATCFSCNSGGMCVPQPVGFPDPTCPANQACAPEGTANPNCMGMAGASCKSNGNCLSNSCLTGACAKGAVGKPCSGNGDCVSGNCQNYVCG